MEVPISAKTTAQQRNGPSLCFACCSPLCAGLTAGCVVDSCCMPVSPLFLPGISPRFWMGWGTDFFRYASSTKQEVIWLRMANIELIIDLYQVFIASPAVGGWLPRAQADWREQQHAIAPGALAHWSVRLTTP